MNITITNRLGLYVFCIYSKPIFLPRFLSERLKIFFVFVVVLSSSHVQATMTDSLTIGNAKALSLGHAVTADPPGIDSIHFNPAGLARLKGTQRHIKLLAADFSIKLKFGEYSEERQAQIDRVVSLISDENANVSTNDTNLFYDEAYNSTSETEGAAAMIPFAGMINLSTAIAPLAGISHSPEGSRMTFGTNVYTPMFLGFSRSDKDPGRFLGEQLSISLITYFSPTVAYEISDSLTVGASINFNYTGLGVNLAFREPHNLFFWTETPEFRDALCAEDGQATFNDLNICGGLGPYETLGRLKLEAYNPLTIGYNLGVLWEPAAWITFGLAYNSAIDLEMKGDFEFPTTPVFQDFFLAIAKGGVYDALGDVAGVFGYSLPDSETVKHPKGQATVDLEMPEHWAVGTSVRITPRIKVNFDVKWTGWSSFEGIPLEFDQEVALLQLAVLADLTGNANNLSTPTTLTFPFGLQDTWNWGLGIEYQYNDRLVLRGGIENRPSATPKEARSPLVPLDKGKLYGLGLGYQLTSGSIMELGVGYFSSKLSIPACSSKLGNSCNDSQVIYNPYRGTDIDTDLKAYLIEFSIQQSI